MTIVSKTIGSVGQVDVTPRRIQMVVTDTLTVVTTANYLQADHLLPDTIYPTDIIDMIYLWNSSTHTGLYIELLVSITAGVITLVVAEGNVALPTVANDIAIFNNTTGRLADSGILITNVVLKNAANTMASGSEIILDKGTGTESSNAVTISKQSGVITTTSLTTAQYATEVITLTNTLIATTSVVIAQIMGGTNTTRGISVQATAGNGSSVITITNLNSAALNGTVIIGFAVF